MSFFLGKTKGITLGKPFGQTIHLFPTHLCHLQPRKAKHATMERTKDKQVVVMDSLEFGTDTSETQPIPPAEMDLLAKNFDEEEPPLLPSPPVVTRLIYVV